MEPYYVGKQSHLLTGLHWTTDPPTEEGWYWVNVKYQQNFQEKTKVVMLYCNEQGLFQHSPDDYERKDIFLPETHGADKKRHRSVYIAIWGMLCMRRAICLLYRISGGDRNTRRTAEGAGMKIPVSERLPDYTDFV
jgi:hypothetical protein